MGYRKNVAALIRYQDLYLACLRSDLNSWQCVQGGVNEKEEVREALFREIEEEIGVLPLYLSLKYESKNWYSYTWPEDILKKEFYKGKYQGQSQKWYFMEIEDPQYINLPKIKNAEFSDFCWITLDELLSRMIYWKRKPLEKFIEELKQNKII